MSGEAEEREAATREVATRAALGAATRLAYDLYRHRGDEPDQAMHYVRDTVEEALIAAVEGRGFAALEAKASEVAQGAMATLCAVYRDEEG